MGWFYAVSVLLSGMAWADAPSIANWRFGKVQLTDLGTGQVRIYMSVRNHGNVSQEKVSLYIVPPQVSSAVGPPTLLLTNQTRGKRSTIVQATLQFPPVVRAANSYRLLLQVNMTITDMLPIEKGQPKDQSAERRRFQH